MSDGFLNFFMMRETTKNTTPTIRAERKIVNPSCSNCCTWGPTEANKRKLKKANMINGMILFIRLCSVNVGCRYVVLTIITKGKPNWIAFIGNVSLLFYQTLMCSKNWVICGGRQDWMSLLKKGKIYVLCLVTFSLNFRVNENYFKIDEEKSLQYSAVGYYPSRSVAQSC